MSNEIEGAMPPMPIPEVLSTRRNRDGDPMDIKGHTTAQMYEYAKAYAAPLVARVAELQAALEKLTLSKIDRECLRIGQQIHRAAGDLPDTYEIEIEIERGSGSVYLCKPDYTKVAFNDHVDGLSESIKDAVDAAIAAKD